MTKPREPFTLPRPSAHPDWWVQFTFTGVDRSPDELAEFAQASDATIGHDASTGSLVASYIINSASSLGALEKAGIAVARVSALAQLPCTVDVRQVTEQERLETEAFVNRIDETLREDAAS